MKPNWLRVNLKSTKDYSRVNLLLRENKLNTVCEGARCPNKWECWSKGTATFMILGDTCTRNCSFCSVKKGIPCKVDFEEQKRISSAVKALNIKYAVITSVTRDDLTDGGANIFRDTVEEIKKNIDSCKVEVLVPDFSGSKKAVQIVADSRPDIFGHNIETVSRLYKKVRPKADYKRSLGILKTAKEKGLTTKSGMMLGLGETTEEVYQTMSSLRETGCSILTLGQYLQPSKECAVVEKYVTPAEFDFMKNKALNIGFSYVESGPLVRSSYCAEKAFDMSKKRGCK